MERIIKKCKVCGKPFSKKRGELTPEWFWRNLCRDCYMKGKGEVNG